MALKGWADSYAAGVAAFHRLKSFDDDDKKQDDDDEYDQDAYDQGFEEAEWIYYNT